MSNAKALWRNLLDPNDIEPFRVGTSSGGIPREATRLPLPPEPEASRPSLEWRLPPARALDLDGPVGRPYQPMGPDYAERPAFEHFRRVAETFPHKIAVSDGHRQFAYGELLDGVVTLARHIAEAVPEGQAVGLLVGNSAWYPMTLLASMLAGRPAVPLNPRDPAQRIADIATDARLSALVGEGPRDLDRWSGQPHTHWIDLASALTNAAGPYATPMLPPASVDEPAVVLYTSGSTGHPKGIVNSQRALLQRVQQYVDACHINADDVFLPLSGPATIAGCREVLTALLCGATLHLADVEAVGLRSIRRQFRSHGVTIVYLVPTLLRAVAAAADSNDFESLRVVRIGGEKILWTDIDLVRRVMPASCFIQISYSSTETPGSQWFLRPDWPENGPSVPAGFVLPGVAFAIVDESGNSVPPGETGELVIRSMYVTLGQWENGRIAPGASDPDDPRIRIFPTGDLACIAENGLLQIVGRKGRQIKINGRRVEPAELEVVLRRSPRVSDAVVIVTDAGELVAFTVPDGVAGPEFTDEIRETIRKSLPPSLHPTRLHCIDAIPRLPGGKVNSGQLRIMDRDLREVADPQSLARGGSLRIGEAVEQVWTSILKTRTAAGRWDEAGGDSLKLLRCVMELEDLVGHELPLEAFTVDMSVTDMIAAIAAGGVSDQAVDSSESRPVLLLLPGSVGYGPSLAAFGTALEGAVHVAPIRYPDLNKILDRSATVSDMADAAMEQIAQIAPDGDVRLLGYSLGGAVAFEVATRLIAAGRSVKFLGVLDTNIDGNIAGQSSLRETVARTLQRIRAHRVTFYRMFCRAVAKGVARMGAEKRFIALLDAWSWPRMPDTRFILRLELEEVLRMRAFYRWVGTPKPRLPIRGTVFRCRRKGPPGLGWERLFAHLDVVPIAGGHLDLVIEPHLATNCPLIKEAIVATCADRPSDRRQSGTARIRLASAD